MTLFRYREWTGAVIFWTSVVFSIIGISKIFSGEISPWWLVVTFFVTHIFILTISVGNHRLFTHKSFECHRFWHYFFTFTSVLSGNDTSCGWAHTHRLHHKYSDTKNDPYAIDLISYFFKFNSIQKQPGTSRMRWLLREPAHRITYQYSMLIFVLFSGCLYVISEPAFLVGYMLAITWHLLSAGMLVVYTHKDGEAVDRPWYWEVFFPSGGEWFHGNHHKSGKAIVLNNATKPGQIDIGYWVSRLIATKGSIKSG